MTTCRRCKRQLTQPHTKQRGIGDVCLAKEQAGLNREQAEVDERKTIRPLLNGPGDVICERRAGYAATNVPQMHVKHSPDGFEWGYGGSGPADFALNILALFIGREEAERDFLYQRFKEDVVCLIPQTGSWVISESSVRDWIMAHRGGGAR